jgi:6-phosphogluconolactonase
MRTWLFLLFAASWLGGCRPAPDSSKRQDQAEMKLFVGTYTKKEGHVDGKGAGIYLLSVAAGQARQLSVSGGIINPSFLALAPGGRFLYAVSETGPDVDSTGYVYAYQAEGDSLRFLNRQPSYSFAPCHISIHPSGRFALVANYVGGVFALYPLEANGRLGEASAVVRLAGSGPHPRQESSHPHSAGISPDGRFAYIPDLGTDKVMIYQIDTVAAGLQPAGYAAVPPGSGPRHITFSADGRFAYVINELSSTISAFRREPASGQLDSLQLISTLPEGFEDDNYCADIHLSPDGRFLYGSNRGHNSLAIFAVDVQSGRLSALGHEPTRGDFPRNFALAPDGSAAYVANQNTGNIAVFQIKADGLLQYQSEISIPSPVCLKFVE